MDPNAFTTVPRPSESSGLPASTRKPGTWQHPTTLAKKLNSLWGRMIDAPLEKILVDDCRDVAQQLLVEMNQSAVMSRAIDVMTVIRTVSVTFGLDAPEGPALKIYLKVLKKLPLEILRTSTLEMIESYVYPTFPKPGEWLLHSQQALREIDRARFMMTIYEQRRQVAEMKYGKMLSQEKIREAKKKIAEDYSLD